MTGNRNLEKIESRISSGLADVFASSREDAFPEVPQHIWQEPIYNKHSNIDTGLDHSSDYASYDRPGSSVETLPGDTLPSYSLPRDTLSGDVFHATMNLGDRGHDSTTSPRFQQEFTPWSHLESRELNGTASAETLRDNNNDEWFYLDQIARYMDIHQRMPIDVHTGFNYVDANNAVRALGLPDLNDNQMMLLIRAGLIVHHYASSATPWRDALGAIEREMCMEANRESKREHVQQQFAYQRLMKQFAEALSYCDHSILLKHLRLWQLHLLHARENSLKLLAFDEQTLLLPYFNGWKAQRSTVLNSTETAEQLCFHKVVRSTLNLYKAALVSEREADMTAERYFKEANVKRVFERWISRARRCSSNVSLASEDVNFSLLSNYFKQWRTARLNNLLTQNLEHQQLTALVAQWRHSLRINQRLCGQALRIRPKLLLQNWRHDLLKVQQTNSRCAEATRTMQLNRVRSILRKGWHESKIESVSRQDRAKKSLLYIRIWRAETRLTCYKRLQNRDIASYFLESWRGALHNLDSIKEKSEHIQTQQTEELQRELLRMLRSKTTENSKNLKPKLSLANDISAGKVALRFMQLHLRRSRDLLKISECYVLRSVIRRLTLESELRKSERLSHLTAEAESMILVRHIVNLLRSWNLRTQAHALDMAKQELALRYGDCAFTLRKWQEAAKGVRELERIAEAQLTSIATSNAIIKWRARMDEQIDAEIHAEREVTLRRGLLAKRILRSWRRQYASVHSKVDEWQEDANRQLAVIYLHALESELQRRRYGALDATETLTSPQRTPSRSNVISPKALKLWTARDSITRKTPKPAGEWGATPLFRRADIAPRVLSTPTKPSRLMRDMKLDSKSEPNSER